MIKTTWRMLLEGEADIHGDCFPTTIKPAEYDLDQEVFPNPEPFLAWSYSRVYFIITDKDDACIESMPRNPCDELVLIEVE